MLKGLLSLTAGAAVFATSVAAHAFTLTNLDGMEHMFTIYAEDDEWGQAITIQPNGTLHHLCFSGCSIALEYDDEQDFRGHETVVIMAGRLIVGKQGETRGRHPGQ